MCQKYKPSGLGQRIEKVTQNMHCVYVELAVTSKAKQDMKLTVSWNEFLNKMKILMRKAEDMLSHEVKTEAELNDFQVEYKSWRQECFNFLSSSFDTNEFAIGFHNAREPRYNLGKIEDLKQKIKNQSNDLKAKRNILESYLTILKVSDAIINPDKIDLHERANFSTEDILELILDKLYDLYDNYYHSVGMILEGNGIVLKRDGEDRELINKLESIGLINVIHTRDTTAQLTISGKIHVENRRKLDTPDYSKVSDSQDEINKKIDQILDKLDKLGLGQEILYEELTELKDLYGRLSKKTWGQLLKGKLIDLVLSQVINKDVMISIYKELTEQVLKLT